MNIKDYSVSAGVTGKSVRYDCPQCNSPLMNPLAEAGSEDSCPDCGASHVVPGIREREAESTRRVTADRLKTIERKERQERSREAVVSRVAKQAKKDRKVSLNRDPFLEWFVYAALVGVVIGVVAGRHLVGALVSDSSGMTLVIVGLFVVGLVLNLMGVRNLRNEYVCAAVCLDTMRKPNGIKELLELPSAGVFHQHLKDLASIAKHDRNVAQDGLVSLLYSRLMAKSRMVEVLSGVLVTLGLIGTVVGLISMTAGLNETLSSLDASEDASGLLGGMRETMAGLGTAFYTTLVGAFLGSVALRVLNNVYTSNVEHLVSYIASIAEVRIVPMLKSAKRAPVNA